MIRDRDGPPSPCGASQDDVDGVVKTSLGEDRDVEPRPAIDFGRAGIAAIAIGADVGELVGDAESACTVTMFATSIPMARTGREAKCRCDRPLYGQAARAEPCGRAGSVMSCAISVPPAFPEKKNATTSACVKAFVPVELTETVVLPEHPGPGQSARRASRARGENHHGKLLAGQRVETGRRGRDWR